MAKMKKGMTVRRRSHDQKTLIVVIMPCHPTHVVGIIINEMTTYTFNIFHHLHRNLLVRMHIQEVGLQVIFYYRKRYYTPVF